MNKQRIKAVALSTVLTAGAFMAGSSHADQALQSVLAVGHSKVADAQKSQARINRMQDETNELINRFRQVSRSIEGLRVHNASLERRLESQRRIMKELEESVGQVTVIQRQVQPLVVGLLDAIEQFIQLDAPYRTEARLARVTNVRNLLDDADVTPSEKFRLTLEIYGIESEYARRIDTYEDTLTIGGQELHVDILSIGRVVLAYQTTDGSRTGVWDRKAQQWVDLDAGQYRTSIRNGILIAQKRAQNDIMLLPIPAPEAAR